MLQLIEGHTAPVRCVAVGEDFLASGSEDDTVRLWALSSGRCLAVLEGHIAAVIGLALAGDVLVSGSDDSTVRIWSTHEMQCLHVLTGHVGTVHGIAIGAACVVSAGMDGTARLWPLERTQSRVAILLHPELPAARPNAVLSVSVEDNLVATGAEDGVVRTWDLTTSKITRELRGHVGKVTSVRLHGKLLVSSALGDQTMRLWSLASPEGDCLTVIDAGLTVQGLAISPLGFVASVGITDSAAPGGKLVIWRPI